MPSVPTVTPPQPAALPVSSNATSPHGAATGGAGGAFSVPESSVATPAHRQTEQKSEEESKSKSLSPREIGGKRRLLIIANRLPVSINITPSTGSKEPNIKLTTSSGGLVSALNGLSTDTKDESESNSDKKHHVFFDSMLWIGWPGGAVDTEHQPKLTQELAKKNSVPVYLETELCDLYYNGFCNNVLWPLFHYISLPIEGIKTLDEQFVAYEKANREFLKVVLSVYRPGDIVWVHDYHLMLLPTMLRESVPDMPIGFFFHTPFPTSEIYRTLPARKTLLKGVMGSNLLGFHTHDYSRHFQSSCSRVLGANASAQVIKLEHFNAQLGTFPIGIDPERFVEAIEKPEVSKYIAELKQQFGDRKVIVGIDRLDYIKGITHKLYAYERFLEENPSWIGKVVLVQVAVPSRTDVPEYIRLRKDTHELVGRINGKYGSISFQPIHYLDQSIPFDKMCGLYRFSDVALISSIRDGMNLVAYEYIVCQKDQGGVLILSEFAGAAQSLGAGAIQINPWSLQESSDAISQALNMKVDESKERQALMFHHVLTHTANDWARNFVDMLMENLPAAVPKKDQAATATPPLLQEDQLVQQFKSARRRLLVLGFDNTLIRFTEQERTEQVKQANKPLSEEDGANVDKTKASIPKDHSAQPLSVLAPKLHKALQALSNDPQTTVVITSSRTRWELASMLDVYGSHLFLVAENGFFLRRHSKAAPKDDSHMVNSLDQWKAMYDNIDLTWKDGVYRVFDYFTERTPGSFIKQQDTYMSWYYDKAMDQSFAERQANDLISHLLGGPLSNTPTEVIHIHAHSSYDNAHSCIQVRPLGVSKGAAIKNLLNKFGRHMRRKKHHSGMGFSSSSAETNSDNEGDDLTDLDDLQAATTDANETTDDGEERAKLTPRARNNSSTTLSASSGGAADRNAPFDFILCVGRFSDRDEDSFTVLSDYVSTGINGLNSPACPPKYTPPGSPARSARMLATAAVVDDHDDDTDSVSILYPHRRGATSASTTATGNAGVTESPILPSRLIVGSHARKPTADGSDSPVLSAANPPLGLSRLSIKAPKKPVVFTCTVGDRQSKAMARLDDVQAVSKVLEHMASAVHQF